MADYTGTLAEGCFGKVYKRKINGAWAAVKKVPQDFIDKKDLERECEVYNIAEHNNIVKLLGNITVSDRNWIIPMEFIFGEDLETTIFESARSKIPLTKENKATIIVGMCEGLNHLHSKDIVHQDLKPDNVMVEHGTCRAVIIDLGLAKFFKGGLNSARDLGNEAYSAPEILRKGVERNQRSDVWAMGKIIAELCARIRLATLSVGPEKIREKISNEPYCNAVCRMVESNVILRATMAGVIRDIRLAGGKVKVVNIAGKNDHQQTPSPNMAAKNRSPSPTRRVPLPVRKAIPPHMWERTPAPPDIKKAKAAPYPPTPLQKFEDLRRNQALVPAGNRDMANEFMKMQLHKEAGLFPPTPLQKYEDLRRYQALVPADNQDMLSEFMKMHLHKEAGEDLPSNLPTTGRVMVRHYEAKNGEVQRWKQQEVVMKGGKIVKHNDVSYHMK